jgi:uncharacterized protein YoxC
MLKGLFRLLLFVVSIVLIYNYFFGDKQEKETSQQIVNQIKDLGKSVSDLMLSEKDKLKDGKYDDALTKIGKFIDNLKSNSDGLTSSELKELNDLEKKKNSLQEKINEIDADGKRSTAEEELLKKEWESLIEEMDAFVKKQKKKE